MLENRAFEIISSARFIEVLYQGSAVWLKSVDKTTEMAEVMPCHSDKTIMVPIAELEEVNI